MIIYFNVSNENSDNLIVETYDYFQTEHGFEIKKFLTVEEYELQQKSDKFFFKLLGGFLLVCGFIFLGGGSVLAIPIEKNVLTLEDVLESTQKLELNVNKKEIEGLCKRIIKTNDGEVIQKAIEKLKQFGYTYTLSPLKKQWVSNFGKEKKYQIFEKNKKIFDTIFTLDKYSNYLKLNNKWDLLKKIEFPPGITVEIIFPND